MCIVQETECLETRYCRCRRGLPSTKMTDDDGGTEELIRRRRQKTEVVTIKDMEHAVGTAIAV